MQMTNSRLCAGYVTAHTSSFRSLLLLCICLKMTWLCRLDVLSLWIAIKYHAPHSALLILQSWVSTTHCWTGCEVVFRHCAAVNVLWHWLVIALVVWGFFFLLMPARYQNCPVKKEKTECHQYFLFLFIFFKFHSSVRRKMEGVGVRRKQLKGSYIFLNFYSCHSKSFVKKTKWCVALPSEEPIYCLQQIKRPKHLRAITCWA